MGNGKRYGRLQHSEGSIGASLFRVLLRYSVVHQFNFNLQLRTSDQIKKRCDQLMSMNCTIVTIDSDINSSISVKEEKAALEEALRAAASAKKKRKHHKDSAQKSE